MNMSKELIVIHVYQLLEFSDKLVKLNDSIIDALGVDQTALGSLIDELAEIILNFVGIPEDTTLELGEKGFCRDKFYDLFWPYDDDIAEDIASRTTNLIDWKNY